MGIKQRQMFEGTTKNNRLINPLPRTALVRGMLLKKSFEAQAEIRNKLFMLLI